MSLHFHQQALYRAREETMDDVKAKLLEWAEYVPDEAIRAAAEEIAKCAEAGDADLWWDDAAKAVEAALRALAEVER